MRKIENMKTTVNTKKSNIKNKYNLSADFYNTRYRNIQYEKYARMLNGMRLSGRILDLGSGTGLLSGFLDKEVIDVDFSINMLKKSKNKNRIFADAENLPFKNGMFDIVLSFTLIQNLPDFSRRNANIYYGKHFQCFPNISGKAPGFSVKSPESSGKLRSFPEIKVFKEVRRILKSNSLFILTILRKKYDGNVKKELEKDFFILKEVDCGEDIGFICRVKRHK